MTLTAEKESDHFAPFCLVETIKHYQLNSQTEMIPSVIGRIQEDLRRLKLFDSTDEMRIAMALSEALLNAIEHGNLEVSSTLREGDDEGYARLIKERSHQSPYAERRVDLIARKSAEEVVYVVQDEGPGFNPDDLPDPTDPANLEKVSGRGVLLIRSLMDSVTYNERGNQITMIKRYGNLVAAVS